MKLFFLLILLLAGVCATSQRKTKIIFKEKRFGGITQKIDSILVIGMGSSSTRIFLDDLSSTLIKDMGENSIVSRYYFLGKDIATLQTVYDTIDKRGYKAILFFLPVQSSNLKERRIYNEITSPPKVLAILGPVEVKMASSKIWYQQHFNFHLALPGVELKKIWTASVEVSCDLRKSKNARLTGHRLLFYFKKNRYIENLSSIH